MYFTACSASELQQEQQETDSFQRAQEVKKERLTSFSSKGTGLFVLKSKTYFFANYTVLNTLPSPSPCTLPLR